MAQDLGYYATFSDLDDPNDSNYHEISKSTFEIMCGKSPITSGLYLASYDDRTYVAYD